MRLLLMMAAAAALSLQSAGFAAAAQPRVDTRRGPVQGMVSNGADAFLGIPYAKAPVGDLRWRAPVAPPSWKAVREATTFGASCYQARPGRFGPYTAEFTTDTAPVSEDCLYLNVWTPSRRTSQAPVLVWIHGGGFGGGSGAIPIYDGARLAAKGAVVVTINYRVGAFGFLAHPELTREAPEGGSGNYGLLDMIAALRWVRANVRQFGGDPTRVTVAGQSAGAMAINDLLLSPRAKGLFSGAIAQSGTAAGPVSVPLAEAERVGEGLAAKVGARSIAELRRLPAQTILEASGAGPPVAGAPPRLRLAPVVDGKIVTADPNDPSRPLAVDTPFLTGYNRDEGSGVTVGASSTPETFEQTVRARYGAFAQRVLALYPHATNAEATASADLLPRDMVTATLAAWADERVKHAKQPVFLYLFDHPFPGPEVAAFRTFHTAEVPYLFGVLDQGGRAFTEADRRISDRMQTYWLNFMRTGDPNGSSLPAWPEVRKQPGQVMALGDRDGTQLAASTPERLTLLREIVAAQGYKAFL